MEPVELHSSWVQLDPDPVQVCCSVCCPERGPHLLLLHVDCKTGDCSHLWLNSLSISERSVTLCRGGTFFVIITSSFPDGLVSLDRIFIPISWRSLTGLSWLQMLAHISVNDSHFSCVKVECLCWTRFYYHCGASLFWWGCTVPYKYQHMIWRCQWSGQGCQHLHWKSPSWSSGNSLPEFQ